MVLWSGNSQQALQSLFRSEHDFRLLKLIANDLPEPRGVNAAAAAAFGEMPIFAGWALAPFGVNAGVKEGDSTLRDFFGLQHSA